jgi:hypothetical protein
MLKLSKLLALAFLLAVGTVISNGGQAQASTLGIDEVTSLRAKVHAEIEHANTEETSNLNSTKSHWLLVNDTAWKWDESALSISEEMVNTHYDKKPPHDFDNDDEKNTLKFDF